MNALRTNTRTLVILGIFAAFALLLSACAASDNVNTTTGNANTTTTTTTTTTSNTAPTPAAPTPAATTSTTTTANANTNAAPAGDKTGVEECDDYLAKYETCLNNKVPAAARAAMKTSFDQTREAWRKAAATPQGKTTLAQACKTAREAAKTSMSAYGCSF